MIAAVHEAVKQKIYGGLVVVLFTCLTKFDFVDGNLSSRLLKVF